LRFLWDFYGIFKKNLSLLMGGGERDLFWAAEPEVDCYRNNRNKREDDERIPDTSFVGGGGEAGGDADNGGNKNREGDRGEPNGKHNAGEMVYPKIFKAGGKGEMPVRDFRGNKPGSGAEPTPVYKIRGGGFD